MTLDKLFEFGAGGAKFLFEKQRVLHPMWIGISDKGAHIPLLVHSLDDKEMVAEKIRQFLKKNQIERYVSMIECWIVEGEAVTPEALAGEPLANNPDRREAIDIFAEDKEGNTMSGRYYILRPEHGRPKLSKLKVDKGAQSTGRFVKMFDQPTERI